VDECKSLMPGAGAAPGAADDATFEVEVASGDTHGGGGGGDSSTGGSWAYVMVGPDLAYNARLVIQRIHFVTSMASYDVTTNISARPYMMALQHNKRESRGGGFWYADVGIAVYAARTNGGSGGGPAWVPVEGRLGARERTGQVEMMLEAGAYTRPLLGST